MFISESYRNKSPHTGCFNNWNVSSQRARARISKRDVDSLAPSEVQTRENLFRASLLGFWWFAGWLWLPLACDASLQSRPSSSHGILPVCVSLCVQTPFYKGHQSFWNAAYPNNFILIWSSVRIDLRRGSQSQVLAARISASLGGHNSIRNSKDSGTAWKPSSTLKPSSLTCPFWFHLPQT